MQIIDGLDFEIIGVTAASAKRIPDTHARWDQGVHPAELNFGDCFA